jgi:hypothetical protein
MNREAIKKVDLRFNEIKEAVIEISQAMKNVPLKDEAIAALVVEAGKGINKTQVLSVLQRLRKLEEIYIKKS